MHPAEAKQEVLSVFQDAVAVEVPATYELDQAKPYMNGYWEIRRKPTLPLGEQPLGKGISDREAWIDAAKRPQEKPK